MSILDRFVSRETGEQKKRKPMFPTPTRILYAELDEAAAEIKEEYPEDSKIVDDFLWTLKEACRTRHKQALEGELAPMRASPRFFLSPDRLTAYACLLPPENGGEDVALEKFLGDMRFEGIVFGVLEAVIPRKFGYLRIFPVARGRPPQAGEDGEVIELFRRRSHMQLEVQNGSQVDFGEDVQLQPIRKGTVICVIHPPKPGTDGMDVTGMTVPCPPVVCAIPPRGKNIALSESGEALTAEADGILYLEDGCFCIHEQKIIEGDLLQESIRIPGSLYVGGNVDGGAKIEASGDIVINGKVGRAQVTSTEGIIRVQQGICGTAGETVLTAGGQVQSPAVELAEIRAGTSVIAETITNCSIHCGGTVYAMTGRGMIVNSQIRAGDSVLCLRIGNLAGGRSRFSVGYPPHLPETWERLRTEVAQAQATVEKLWDPITTLRKKPRLSDGERQLLARLTEQRDLYMKRMEELRAQLREINKALDKKSRGRIRCEKLYPLLEVQFGRLTEEITTIEEKCSIHVEENSIHLTEK